jgi:glycosyltransferase involved in cell wall biosynthesis
LYDGEGVVNGINVWLQHLLPALQAEGINTSCFCVIWSPPERCETMSVLRSKGIHCETVSAGLYSEQQCKLFLAVVERLQPSIVVANACVPALMASRWLRPAGVPVVAVIHNDDAEYAKLIATFVAPNDANTVPAVVAVSKELFEIVQNVSPEDLLLREISCGARIAPHYPFKKEGAIKILFAGRLTQEQKRIHLVLESFIAAARLHPSAEFHLFGDGPEHSVMAQTLASSHLQNVHLHGFTTPDLVHTYMLNSHFIVCLSTHEGMPVSIMEGMGAGLVPICTRMRSGIGQLIIENETGVYVEPTVDSFCSTLGRLINDVDSWNRLSLAAYSHIQTSFSTEVTQKSWLHFLDLLSNRFQSRRPVAIPERIRFSGPRMPISPHDRRKPSLMARLARRIYSRVLV